MVEEANVNQGEQQQQQQSMAPTQMVDVDTLVWQLGQNVVEKMGYQKLVDRIQEQIQSYADTAKQAQQARHEMQLEKEKIQSANEALDAKNKELADTLKAVREERKIAIHERDELQKELDRRDRISNRKKKRKG